MAPQSLLSLLTLIGLYQEPLGRELDCYPFADFVHAVEMAGGKVTQTVETPSFPSVKQMVVVTLEGTKQVYLDEGDCVIAPPVYVDAPDGMEQVPTVRLVPLKRQHPA